MRKIALVLCVALMMSLFSGCGGQDAYVPTGNALEDDAGPTQETAAAPGVLDEEAESYTLAYSPEDGFNPYQCETLTNRMLFSLLYQGLFAVDRNYNVEPMLCKSYTMTEDMMSYTFYLEPAVFSDGSYLLAGDVVASLNAARESDLYGGRFENIVAIESLDDNSVTITADCAYENLPILLDIPILKSGQVNSALPAGTGPYSVVPTTDGMALQRRSDWWCQAELPVDSQMIPLWEATDPVQIRDRFEFDDLGLSYADPGSAGYADYRSDYEVWDCETGIMLYLGCNANSYVFSNSEIRTALTYAIDREVLVEKCYNGFAQTAALPASPSSPYYDKGLAEQVSYEPQRLKSALQDSTLTGTTVVLLVNQKDTVRLQAARLISDMLSECGLTVKLLEASASEYQDVLKEGSYDLYLGQTRLSANMDLSEFFMPNGYLSDGGMTDAACYKLCQESLENIGNYYNLHQMILQDGQLTPLLFRTYAVFMERGLLEGLSPSRDNVFWYSIGKTMEDALVTE